MLFEHQPDEEVRLFGKNQVPGSGHHETSEEKAAELHRLDKLSFAAHALAKQPSSRDAVDNMMIALSTARWRGGSGAQERRRPSRQTRPRQ